MNFGESFESDIQHCIWFFEKIGGGIPTLNFLIIFINRSSSIWYTYTKYVSFLTTEQRAIFVLWCKAQVYHKSLRSIFEKIGCGVPTLNMLIIFMNLYSSSWSIYNKDVSNLKITKHDIFEFWFKFNYILGRYVF